MFRTCTSRGELRNTSATNRRLYLSISTSTEIAADSNTFTTTATTIYIRVTDTQKSGTANSQNTLNIDQLALKTTP